MAAVAEQARADNLGSASAAIWLPDSVLYGEDLSAASRDRLMADTASNHAHGDRTAAQLAAEGFPCTAADGVITTVAAEMHAERSAARTITITSVRRPSRSV